MAGTATTLVSVEQYLRTPYSPDREFVDGQIQERHLGEYDHAAVQTAVADWFRQRRREWGIRAVVELRVQVAPTRFRVPDVCVLRREPPREQMITDPPRLAAARGPIHLDRAATFADLD